MSIFKAYTVKYLYLSECFIVQLSVPIFSGIVCIVKRSYMDMFY
jgi:hypothetical protein